MHRQHQATLVLADVIDIQTMSAPGQTAASKRSLQPGQAACLFFAADASFSLVAIMVSQMFKTLFEVSIMQYRNIKVRSLNGYYYQHRNKKLSIRQALVTCHFTYF